MKISLIVFTLNEIDGMRAIMPRIKKEWYDELIIVDGGSIDGTIEYAKEHGYNIFVQKGRDTGAAFWESFEKVTGDTIIIFCPDGNSIPEKIPEMVEKYKEGYDMVTVSRYLDGAKSYDDDWITAFGNRMFTGIINCLFNARVTDALGIYRIFNKQIIYKLNIDTYTPSWGTQILLRAIKRGLKIAEIPGDEPKRIGGKRKMRPVKNGFYELKMIISEGLIP